MADRNWPHKCSIQMHMPETWTPPSHSSTKPETILVVDDDPDVLRVVVAILKLAKFRVLSTDSGANAVELSEGTEEKIDLLLSDLNMPEMSGPDLGELLKKARPDIRVMLMSGGSGWKPVSSQLRLGPHPEAFRGEKAG